MNQYLKCKSRLFFLLVVACMLVNPAIADVLVDNMEGPRQNQSLAQGYWFLYLDTRTHETGNTRLIYPTDYNFRFYPQGYNSGHSARIHAVLGGGYRSPFLGIGLNLDQYRGWYDFSEATMIEFWARGKGSFRLRLRDSISVQHTPEKNLQRQFYVCDEWKLYQFEFSEFVYDDDSHLAQLGKTNKEILKAIGTIIFASASYQDRDAGVEIDLQIDNIVVRGIDSIGAVSNNAPKFVDSRDNRTVVEMPGPYMPAEHRMNEYDFFE